MPEPPNTAIAVGKGVDQLQLIVKYTAADQHVYVAGFGPFQQFHHQIWNVLGERSKVQHTTFLVHHTHRSGAEHSRFLHQSPGHDAVSQKQIIHGIGVKLVQTLVYFVGVLDLSNVLWRSQYRLAVQHRRDLIQRQRVLLDG